ncbi:glucose-1-phosphate adenylyltransferase large subunit 1, chloroplastic-like [Camellia sinensis]|uniref:glucose-1-phosphate adenylyltransferase large subunit 1, chloroplastic-like n=1 Tax=Camellia sinensis TaxID=4442 RepID=UPI001035781D|nr:glucose-1-phosphate adenylyltransferase large subunit 1, chloroplastic-like [Camellia sinensis]
MALSADGRITLSAAGQLSGATASLAGKRLVKFCNGELMGKKLKGVKGNVRPHVCMTLTTNVAGEAKLRDLEMEKRDPRTVAAIILGGGAGIRLFPLTKCSAKPAVPIGGSYRLIDVPMTTQTPGKEGKRWFQGTANTVRQFHWLFEDERSKDVEDVVILSGDHLYRMDYMDFVQNHRQSGADITLSCLPMDYSLVIVFSQLGFPSGFNSIIIY